MKNRKQKGVIVTAGKAMPKEKFVNGGGGAARPRNPYAKAFYDFCLANPELRFWQAVYNFTGVKNIFISNKTKEETTMITVADPFHWEGLDK